MKKKEGFVVGLLATALLLLLLGFAQAAPIILKLGNIQAPNSSASIACERMAKLAAEKSNGRLKIEFFPSSQLGNAITELEGVMMGTQDMFQDAAEWMSQFEKDYNILAMASYQNLS
jgi:C4-dicarboxylate-binding protein DctP